MIYGTQRYQSLRIFSVPGTQQYSRFRKFYKITIQIFRAWNFRKSSISKKSKFWDKILENEDEEDHQPTVVYHSNPGQSSSDVYRMRGKERKDEESAWKLSNLRPLMV